MIDLTESEIMRRWPEGYVNEPLVSVRCMTFNHAKYVAQTLDSFLMQETDFPFEIVIHDDASTDSTQEIIREYHQKYPQIIKPILQTENQYSKPNGREYMRGLINGSCKGKYMAWCEGDDYWIDSKKLQKQVDYLESHPDCSMVFNSANFINDSGKVFFVDSKGKEQLDFGPEKIIRGGGSFCATASMCLRSEFAGYLYKFQRLSDVGDYPLQIALSLKGKVHYLPDVMTVYRVSESNQNSWTNRVEKNKEKAVKHLNNEISWLKVLDEESDFRYSEAVSYTICVSKIELFELGAISKKEMFDCYKQLKFVTKLRIIKRRLRRLKKNIKNRNKGK